MIKMTGTLHEGQCAIMVIYRSIILGMRAISDKRCRVHEKAFYAQ
jgi:hypothetical protein